MERLGRFAPIHSPRPARLAPPLPPSAAAPAKGARCPRRRLPAPGPAAPLWQEAR